MPVSPMIEITYCRLCGWGLRANWMAHAIASIPPPDKITPDTPLRLSIAAAIAFPDGSMTAAGLRREAERGRLVIERVAGKDYVTLRAIDEMRSKCRVEIKALAYTLDTGASAQRSGSSSIMAARSAQERARAIAMQLKKPSQSTSAINTDHSSERVTRQRS